MYTHSHGTAEGKLVATSPVSLIDVLSKVTQ